MKKFFAICVLTLALTGCNCNNCNDENTSSEMEFAPDGAKFIKKYNSPRSLNLWTMWELDGQCFLSYNINSQTGLLTKVDCPEGTGE